MRGWVGVGVGGGGNDRKAPIEPGPRPPHCIGVSVRAQKQLMPISPRSNPFKRDRVVGKRPYWDVIWSRYGVQRALKANRLQRSRPLSYRAAQLKPEQLTTTKSHQIRLNYSTGNGLANYPSVIMFAVFFFLLLDLEKATQTSRREQTKQSGNVRKLWRKGRPGENTCCKTR